MLLVYIELRLPVSFCLDDISLGSHLGTFDTFWIFWGLS